MGAVWFHLIPAIFQTVYPSVFIGCRAILLDVSDSVNIPTDPTGVPQNFIAGAASSTSITLRWEAPLADLQNGIIRSYHISVVELETGRVRLFTTNNTDRVLIVNLLHPFYTYNCTIGAYTIGPGPSISVSVRTLPEGILCMAYRVIA